MIAVGMADEDLFRTRLRFTRIEPEREFRKIDSAPIILERQRGHGNNLSLKHQVSRAQPLGKKLRASGPILG